MSASSSAFRGLIDIFAAPADALQAAYDHPRRLWLPLVLVLVAMAVFWIWYYQTVDFDWLVGHFLSNAGREMTPEQLEAGRDFMSPTSMTIQSLVAVVVITILMLALVALYLHIVAKVSGHKELEYGRWFSLGAWTSFPTVLIVAGMALNYGLSDSGHVPPQMLAVTNLANLLAFDMSVPGWQRALGSFDIVMIWQVFLTGLGVSMYLERSLSSSIVIAAIPTVFFYGISVLIAIF